MDRRTFIIAATSSSALVALPSQTIANPFGITVGRFISGLVFNVARAVFVQLAADWIVQELRSGRRPKLALPLKEVSRSSFEHQFLPENYQASLVVSDYTDYVVDREQRVNALIKDADTDSLSRLSEVRKYLYDNKVEAAFYAKNQEGSRRIRSDEPLSNLLSVRYIASDNASSKLHYRTLIEKTQSEIFEASQL